MNGKYLLKYSFELERGEFGRPAEAVPKEEGVSTMDKYGLCDAYMFVSILKPNLGEEGPYSTLITGRDGTRPPGDDDLQDLDRFKVWAGLARSMAESDELLPWQKNIALQAADRIREVILTLREIDGK